MQHRRVGRSGLEVSRLALGTMSWGAAVDAYEAEDQLKTFVDADGTLVDTAPIYGDGNCEELLHEGLFAAGFGGDEGVELFLRLVPCAEDVGDPLLLGERWEW